MSDQAPKTLRKAYLGDGVYADFDGFAVVLTTENGIEATNKIVLEPEVLEQLEVYVKGLRAAKKGELGKIPAVIRDLTDLEVAEAQLVENCQRSDVHPLEEADALKSLLDVHKVALEDLVVKVGKSRGYIYGRLKLCDLQEPGRKAFFEGKLNASIALMLARIPDQAVQKEATKKVLEGDFIWDNDSGQQIRQPWSVRKASAYLQEHYMLRLADAPFSKTADLIPLAGPCSTCPKRTGNQRELFEDVKSADVCTDPACFALKKAAHWKLEQAKAEEKGLEVVRKGVKFHDDRYGHERATVDEHRSDYIDLDAKPALSGMNAKKTYRQLIGKKLEEAAVGIAKDDKGKVHQVISKEDAKRLLKGTEVKVAEKYLSSSGSGSSSKPESKEAKAKREAEQKLQEAVAARVVDGVLAKIETTFDEDPAAAIRLVLSGLDDGWAFREVLQRRKLKGKLEVATKGMRAGALLGLLFECEESSMNGTLKELGPDEVAELAKRFGVDVGGIEKSLTPSEEPKPICGAQDGKNSAICILEPEHVGNHKAAKGRSWVGKPKKDDAPGEGTPATALCRVPGCWRPQDSYAICGVHAAKARRMGLSVHKLTGAQDKRLAEPFDSLLKLDDERTCRECGCTEADACPDRCSWVATEVTRELGDNLCSSCQPPAAPAKGVKGATRPCVVPDCPQKATVGLSSAWPMCQRHHAKLNRAHGSGAIKNEDELTSADLKLLAEDGRQKRGAA